MSHLPFTFLAYLLNAIAVTTDKFLLTKKIPDPLVYVFYFSLVSLASLVLLPFTRIPDFDVFFLASLSTLLWTSGAYFMFKALQIGQVSRAIPVIGTLIPLMLLVEATFTGTISEDQIWAVVILILGIVVLTLPDLKGRIVKKELLFEFVSSFLFASSYILLREAYLREGFLTVFVWSRPVLVVLGVIIFLTPFLRKKVFFKNDSGKKFRITKTTLLFVMGQVAGGVSELLLTFSIALASPALVNSMQGVQYAFLFVFSLILGRKFPDVFKENYSKKVLLLKILGILLIAAGLYIMSFAPMKKAAPHLGVTFSPKYAEELGLKPVKLFDEMISDLKLEYLRLPVYWDEVESTKGMYDFSKVDHYLSVAQEKQIKVILVLGLKQPRWPECFSPPWFKELNRRQKEEKILALLAKEVKHFKNSPAVVAWQVENEPLLKFGKCDPVDGRTIEFLSEEVSLVKTMDPSRPVVVTDSGELSTWAGSLPASDIFGTTVYRQVWNPVLGLISYPLPPMFYKAKAYLVKSLTGAKTNSFIVAELQTEPWAYERKHLRDLEMEKLAKIFPSGQIAKNVDYARKTGFDEIYLWGVEWWYYARDKGYPQYILEATKIFQ